MLEIQKANIIIPATEAWRLRLTFLQFTFAVQINMVYTYSP
jgi:hypothetical protein